MSEALLGGGGPPPQSPRRQKEAPKKKPESKWAEKYDLSSFTHFEQGDVVVFDDHELHKRMDPVWHHHKFVVVEVVDTDCEEDFKKGGNGRHNGGHFQRLALRPVGGQTILSGVNDRETHKPIPRWILANFFKHAST